MIKRAQGCLLGQFIGDALGAPVENLTSEQIAKYFPNGVLEYVSGGAHDTIAGQITDDSEMAISLARSIIENNGYKPQKVRQAYVAWVNSEPFDIGVTILSALGGWIKLPKLMRFSPGGQFKADSQANGALMRVSPLAIYGSNFSHDVVAELAATDCKLTHIHHNCIHVNQIFATAVAYAIKTGADKHSVYKYMLESATKLPISSELNQVLADARHKTFDDYKHNKGWVLLAFQNAVYQLLNAENFEGALVDTISRGGDTDTNACICGALYGAVCGIDNIPLKWIEGVLNCKPTNDSFVAHPRPEYYWANDALEISKSLLNPLTE